MLERVIFLTALIVERPMCLECIADRVSLPLREIATVLQQVARRRALHHEPARCRTCGATQRVVSVDRRSAIPDP
jgi:predicted Zn-ribbon and HTH transcriptional regulator